MPVNDGLKIPFGYLFSIPWYLTFVGFRIDVSGCLKLLLVIDESLLDGEKEEVQGSTIVLWFISLKCSTFEGKDLLEGTIIWLDDNLILDWDWDSS